MSLRAVITGVGVIAPNGIGKKEYWQSVSSGISGISVIDCFDTAHYETRIAGEIHDFEPSRFMEKRKARLLSRFAQFALAGARMAVDDAGLRLAGEDTYRIGVALGNTVGGKEVEEEQQRVFLEHGSGSVNPFTAARISNNYAVGAIATEFGIRGPNMTLSTGCTSALNAVGYAFDLIKAGRAEVVLAGGSETPLVPSVFEAFYVTGALSRQKSPAAASRPFDQKRDGYVLAEGCGILVVEELEHALRRGATIYAELCGYGMTNDGFSLFKMEPTGREVAKAIRLALASGGIAPAEIDYINAHGSSSPLTDRRETNAIKIALGPSAYHARISSVKSMIGQPLGAAGGLQAVTTALALHYQCIPPTINYEDPDPSCDLDYTPNRALPCDISTALINCFGLGGNNASLVMRKYMPDAHEGTYEYYRRPAGLSRFHRPYPPLHR